MENSRTKLPPSQSRRQSRNKLSLHVKEEDTSLPPSLFLFRKNEPLLPFFLPFSLSFIPKPSHLLLSFFFFSFLSIFTSLKVKEEETRRMNNFSRRVLLREIISSLLLGSFYRALSSFKGLWLGQPLQHSATSSDSFYTNFGDFSVVFTWKNRFDFLRNRLKRSTRVFIRWNDFIKNKFVSYDLRETEVFLSLSFPSFPLTQVLVIKFAAELCPRNPPSPSHYPPLLKTPFFSNPSPIFYLTNFDNFPLCLASKNFLKFHRDKGPWKVINRVWKHDSAKSVCTACFQPIWTIKF